MSGFAGSLDTNVLLRLILNDIPAQRTAAKRLIEKHRSQFAIADTALYEVAFTLSRHYGFDRAEVAGSLRDVMALPYFNCNRVMFTQALDMYVGHPALSLEDCALVSYARLNDAVPLYTFDQKLAKQAPGAALIPA